MARDGRKWAVFVDTDGGTTTDLSMLGIKAADKLVVPTLTNDSSRVFNTMGVIPDNKPVTVVFNKVRVKQNEPTDLTNFTVHDADTAQMEAAVERMKHLSVQCGKPRYVVRELGKFGTLLYTDPYADAPSGVVEDVLACDWF